MITAPCSVFLVAVTGQALVQEGFWQCRQGRGTKRRLTGQGTDMAAAAPGDVEDHAPREARGFLLLGPPDTELQP
jgi:hypothetical protein